MSQFSLPDSGASLSAQSFDRHSRKETATAGDATLASALTDSISPFGRRSRTDGYFQGESGADHPALPGLKLDGSPERSQTQASTASSSIVRDGNNNIARITYPDGRNREFGRDAAGNLNSVTTRDSQGTSKLVKENGKWAAEIEGRRLPLPGAVILSAQGTLSLPLEPAGTFRTETVAGGVFTEKSNASQARVALNADGRIERITHKDGRSLSPVYENGSLNQIVEEKGDGSKPVTWKKQRDIWSSDQQPPQQRLNMELHENGNLSYTGCDGLKHIVRGNGAQLLEGPGKGKFSFDRQGRISSIEYADGKTIRSFAYDGDTNKINSVTVDDKIKQTKRIYARNGNSDSWTITDGAGKNTGTWSGDVTLSPDGIYSVKRRDGKHNRGEDPEGGDKGADKERDKDKRRGKKDGESDDNHDSDNDGGDENDGGGEDSDGGNDNDGGCNRRRRRRRRGRRNDWDRRDNEDRGGEDSDETDGSDDADKGKRDGDGEDDPEDGRDNDADEEADGKSRKDRRNKSRDENTRHEDDDGSDGSWHSFRPDGSDAAERSTEDGSKATFDRSGNLMTIRRADGSAVDAVYAGGKLSQVIESSSKSGERITWTKQKDDNWTSDSPEHKEILRNLSFNKDGDMLYSTSNGIKHTIRLDGTTLP